MRKTDTKSKTIENKNCETTKVGGNNMRNVLNKLENDKKIFNLKIKFVRLNIRQSLSYLHERIKSYATIIRKEDNNQDSFERYLRIRKLEARRAKFFSLKIKIIFAYSEACTDVRLYLKAKNHPEKYQEDRLEELKEKFENNKNELCKLIEELQEYPEILLEEAICRKIQNWQIEDYTTMKDIENWENELSHYFSDLDII
ncbi:MAG: hypothetical protein ACLS90_05785 [Clostridia bacterium]